MEKQDWLTKFLRNSFLIAVTIIGIAFLIAQIIGKDGYFYHMVFKNYAEMPPFLLPETDTDLFLCFFQRYFWQIASAILLFVVGGIFIVFGLVIKYNSNNNVGLCYLGIFSIIVAMWLVCQSDMRSFYFRNISAAEVTASLALLLVPVPKMLFLNDLMKYRYQKIYNAVIGIALLNTVVSMLLAGMGWASLTELRVTAHVVILLTGVVCLGCFFQYARTQKFVAPKAITIGVSGLVIAALAEYINFLFIKAFYPGKYIGSGILFFLLMLGYATEKSWVVQWQEYKRTIEENAFKNAFLAGMSHEIKTPINTILGMNEMIIRESREPAIKGYADNIYEAGELLLSLVNNILDYTKMESGEIKIIPVRYETGQLFSSLINSVNMKIDEKKLRFDIDVDENIPCILFGDELRIRQAVINLLENALKETKEGSISFKAWAERKSQAKICLSVSISNTGLGTGISRQIMEMMQGRVEVANEQGKKSSVTLIFEQKIIEDIPIGHFEEWYRTAYSIKRYHEVCYQAEDVKILVVDDNEMNIEVMKGLLKNTGAVIDTASGAAEGISKAGTMKYDIILLDHMMPEMDGIEALQQLRKIAYVEEEKIPIIALTANAILGAREEYLQKGFTDYIAKPVDYRTLIMTLKKYLPDKIKKCPKTFHKQSVCERYLEEQGIHVKSAMKYVADEFEQYIHLLEMFTSKQEAEKELTLQQAYACENWKDYMIYVHALKNTARTIGADKLADIAYEHEQKSKEGDIAFLQETYKSLIQEWKRTKEIITIYLNTYYADRKECLEESENAQESGESEWEETLEQIIGCLESYKKKEALVLLKKLSEDRLAEGRRHNIEQAIEAVQGYEYECAIQILKET